MVSLKQVAALAGVSSSTVSRAVVAPERLHPKTLEKVREAIASLDYVPFAPARVLRSGRSRTIGIVAPTLMNELYARAVDTLEKEFLQFGYTGLLTCHRDMFYNPVTAKPFEWEFHRGRKVTEIPAEGRLLVSDVEAMLGACIAGAGIAQVMEIGVEQMMRDGLLVDIFPDWSDERFPLYALFPSRRHRAAKVEAFINFCLESLSAASPAAHRQMGLRGGRQRKS